MKCIPFLPLTALLTSAAAKVYTGFSYGAYWGDQTNVKRYADFHHGFELAKNLTDTPIPFNSARLYTCITADTQNDPTEAFQAAIDTGTNLLLGMWVSPGTTGYPNDALVENELVALGKGFEQHGQKLAELIIGLSVGSEDIYRSNSQQAGVGSDKLLLTMQSVRGKIAAAPWAKYMEGKPIGHTDTATYAVVPGSDFVGMTAYPYWEGRSIDNANATFMSTLRDTERHAGNTPVWVTEIGWPVNGTKMKDAVASADNYQRYWDEVGCQLFGKYNTFWFELLQDTVPDQPDWGLLEAKTYKPRIKDLSCGRVRLSAPAADGVLSASHISAAKSIQTTFSTIYVPTLALARVSSSLSVSLPMASASRARTIHITETRTVTVQPTSPATGGGARQFTLFSTTTTYVSATPSSNATLPSNSGTSSGDKITACIVMMDLVGDGVFMPVVTYAADLSTCMPPPQFTGSPFTMIAGPATVQPPTEQKSSFDLYAHTSSAAKSSLDLLASLTTASSTTAVQTNGPTCVTVAGLAYEAVIVDGRTYTGKPTAFCSSDTPAISAPTASKLSTLKATPSISPAACSPNPTPASSSPNAGQTEEKTICLKRGVLARISAGVPWVLWPEVRCSASTLLISTLPTLSVTAPSTMHTPPITPTSHTTTTQLLPLSSTRRRSPGPAVPHEADG